MQEEKWKFLIESTEGESIVIESVLRANGIVVLKKSSGAQGYLRIIGWMPGLNVKLYVPEDSYEQAVEIIKTIDEK
ncbi:MAG TPA: DUF2007 domain-containing protein [bacterium]|nr:DUF2007 domain-containing protein [bacterium]HPO51573.1 DUF2007 domain-containing protein [bacterium]HXK45513.1 DUF2007 domain-containing protein [bacterium]